MAKSNHIPLVARYEYSSRLASRIIMKYSTPVFPLDILSIINKTNLIKLNPYSHIMKEFSLTLEETCSAFGSEDGSVQKYPSKKKPYVISFNDLHSNSGRVLWSIAHEFAHIALGHLDNYPQLEFYRNGLTESEYKILEMEADTFTSHLLAPLCLLRAMRIDSELQISKLTGLSETASKNRLKALKRYTRFPNEHELQLLNFFELYIKSNEQDKLLNPYYCMVCDKHTGHKTIGQYCNHCNSIVEGLIHKKRPSFVQTLIL